jgi:hypothetical protein
VTRVRKGWHDSCWMVQAETCARPLGASPLTGLTVVSPIPCALGVREEPWRMRAEKRRGTWQRCRAEGKTWWGALTAATSNRGRRYGRRTSDACKKCSGATQARPRALWRFCAASPVSACGSMHVHSQADIQSCAAAMPKKEKR